MRGGAAAMKLVVASRMIPKIAREAKTEDGALRIVREAIESNGTLKAMGENRADDKELLDVTCEAMAAARPTVQRELQRRRIARGLADSAPRMLEQAGRMAALDRGEADPRPDADAEAASRIADEAMRELREQGIL